MAQIENRTSLSPEEKRSLSESARLCEVSVEATPSDTGALETLKEIYTKLGDRENLARVVARLAGTVGGRPSASVISSSDAGGGPRGTTLVDPVLAAPPGDTGEGRGAGRRGAAAPTSMSPPTSMATSM